MIIRDRWLINNIDILFEKKIVLYGAGSYGAAAYDIISNIEGMKICCFCETDVGKWKEKKMLGSFHNTPVKSVGEIKKELESKEIIIIVTTRAIYHNEIIKNINMVLGEEVQVFTWFGFYFCIEVNIDDKRISEKYREQFLLQRDCKRKNSGIENNANDAHKLLKNNSVLVYQPGKVASSTVSSTLSHYGIDNIQIHHISHYDREKYGYHEAIDNLYKWWIKNIATKEPVRVISLVRDPIARSISTYFQIYHEDYSLSDDVLLDPLLGAKKYIDKEMKEGDAGYLFKWFDDEIFETFDINVFDFPFNKEKGYGLICQGNIHILLLTVEQLLENKDIIETFLNINGLQFLEKNVGREKPYRFVYNDVLNEISVEEDVLDFYYRDNKKMKHFYTEEQIEKFRSRWRCGNKK